MLCVMTRSALSRSSSNMSSVSRSASAALLSRARMSRSRSVSLVIGRPRELIDCLRDLVGRELLRRGHVLAVGGFEMQRGDGGWLAHRAAFGGGMRELDLVMSGLLGKHRAFARDVRQFLFRCEQARLGIAIERGHHPLRTDSDDETIKRFVAGVPMQV